VFTWLLGAVMVPFKDMLTTEMKSTELAWHLRSSNRKTWKNAVLRLREAGKLRGN